MLGTQMDPRAFLDRVSMELGRIDPAQVKKMSDLIYECYELSRFVFVIGNGGSGSNASHFCEDIGKGTLKRSDFGLTHVIWTGFVSDEVTLQIEAEAERR